MSNTWFLPSNRIVYAIIVLLKIQTALAQSVGFGTTNPSPSARLEVSSTTQGILIPTLTTAQRSAINNPAIGLLVYQTNGTRGFYYYNGIVWINLTNGSQPNSEGIAISSSYGLTTTFAGTGSIGSADGISTAASFQAPGGVAIDISGNVYVADTYNQKIRKIVAGVVSTLAGSGFNFPYGVAVDASGIVYVADRFSHRILKVTPAGAVSTLAGSGSPGNADGTGSAASFNHPTGVAVDASGNIYVADFENHKIRKITATGVVSTLAGSGSPGNADGAGIQASFNRPYGVAVDAAGSNIYVADYLNHKIRKITAVGIVTTLAGSGSPGSADGISNTASFYGPTGVAVDASGNVYVADLSNHKIRRITAGVVTTLAGNGSEGAADGIGNAASFRNPFGVGVDATGNVYVGDESNNKIRKIIAR